MSKHDNNWAKHQGYKKGRKDGYKHGFRNGKQHSDIPRPVSRKITILLVVVAAGFGFLIGLLF